MFTIFTKYNYFKTGQTFNKIIIIYLGKKINYTKIQTHNSQQPDSGEAIKFNEITTPGTF